MSNTPRVSITFSNGNLLKNIAMIDGLGGFIGTGAVSENLNKVFVINSLQDAIAQGITLVEEPAAYKVVKEFYEELGGNQQIYMLLVDETVTMAEMLDSTSVSMANKLMIAGEGKISCVGVFRKPPMDYDGGTDFFDTDVQAALTAAKTFVQAQNAKLSFTRVLISGLLSVESSTSIFAPNTASDGYAGVVLGDTVSGKGATIGMAVGRKMKYPCNIKVGKVANGPLSATAIFIGTKPLNQVVNLDALHGKGVISFVTYPQKAGFYFGIDNMASDDDYHLLVYGCTVDAVAKVAADVYTDELEANVDTNPDGTIKELDAKHLEDRIEQQVAVSLGNRISGFSALVNRSSNIINTSRTSVKLSVLPNGYNTWIDVEVGLTAGN